MKQTSQLDNACGIIACLHSIYNNQDNIPVEDGSILKNFLAMTAGKSAAERATLLEGYQQFKDIHKEAASQGQSGEA